MFSCRMTVLFIILLKLDAFILSTLICLLMERLIS